MSDLTFALISVLAGLACLGYCLGFYFVIRCGAAPVKDNPFARFVPERWRWAHRWFARFARYAWQPCPLCGQEFGGHEWRDIGGRSSVIHNPASKWWGGLGICPSCTRAGRGDPTPFCLYDQHHAKGD